MKPRGAKRAQRTLAEMQADCIAYVHGEVARAELAKAWAAGYAAHADEKRS